MKKAHLAPALRKLMGCGEDGWLARRTYKVGLRGGSGVCWDTEEGVPPQSGFLAENNSSK